MSIRRSARRVLRGGGGPGWFLGGIILIIGIAFAVLRALGWIK